MKFEVLTKGHYDFVNITEKIRELINHSKIKDGVVLIFVKGTTAAITLMALLILNLL